MRALHVSAACRRRRRRRGRLEDQDSATASANPAGESTDPAAGSADPAAGSTDPAGAVGRRPFLDLQMNHGRWDGRDHGRWERKPGGPGGFVPLGGREACGSGWRSKEREGRLCPPLDHREWAVLMHDPWEGRINQSESSFWNTQNRGKQDTSAQAVCNGLDGLEKKIRLSWSILDSFRERHQKSVMD